MNDPIKIIWKYKNTNRRVQYSTYIYVGKVPEDIMSILNKIAEKNLYDSLIFLPKTELKKLEDYYGLYWYTKFFNMYHVNNTVNIIKDTAIQVKELTDKFGAQWYSEHIEGRKLIDKKILYNYASLIRDEKIKKSTKKGRTVSAIIDDETDLDYTTKAADIVSKIFNLKTTFRQSEGVTPKAPVFTKSESVTTSSSPSSVSSSEMDSIMSDLDELSSGTESEPESETKQSGGCIDGKCKSCNLPVNYDTLEPVELLQTGGEDEDLTLDEMGEETVGDEEVEDFDESQADEEIEEEMDEDDLEKLYADSDVVEDSNVEQTSELIKKALDDEKLINKKIAKIIEFDTSKDNNMYDENLKNVFNKIYVKEQFIFKDDTIKTIKDKICCSIKNHDSYLIPSRQYLWTEYYWDNSVEKIMLGQKWIRRNELLKIDVEPNNNMRYYEELRGTLRTLRDNIKRYGNKIRREDDDNNILFDYETYMLGNEIYMIDIYNELGSNYSPDPETTKNLIDVYVRLYFPRIKTEDVKYIIDYMNGNKLMEENKIMSVFETINNDLILTNEVVDIVEKVKTTNKYQSIFKENYITQSVIHVSLRIIEGKIDLYRIFNEFEPTDKYPFLQYQTMDGTIFFKYKTDDIQTYLKKKENADVLGKWFENSPYGISFKIKTHENEEDRFTAINLNDAGRVEYKTQWKEEDMATIDDIKGTYSYVKDLITKINKEKNKVKFEVPEDFEFKYAFINTIQKFELPEQFIINHNDLSEFSRYFYPYVSLVIEPRKRQAKITKADDKSKFGTYLRYKRVSKYENPQRLEQRIMYFMRNYEYTVKTLGNEIAKQFNITEERALEEIERVQQKYPHIKKSRKVLKKLENIPKYKPPGIGIDIQGKQRDKYKIRISGARDKQQLDRIINFMNILIYLYSETYLYKKPEREILKEKLKKLTNIAKRRSKVDDIVAYEKEIKAVKQMTQVDKQRLGYKPEKGQNQWSRLCQNSGTDKKRQPQQFSVNNMGELIKKGYTYNKKTGEYELKYETGKKSNKKTEILRTIKLKEFDENGESTGNDIHYACSPDVNGEHAYIGFLTKSSNPNGFCMPCCFKKDPSTSKNKEKQEFFNKCLAQANANGKTAQGETLESAQKLGDKLYILQDTNKIQEGRFGFLPNYLDLFFNSMLGKSNKRKHHYLLSSQTGYFFKYGSKQDEFAFLNALGSLLDLSVEDIRNKIAFALENDKTENIFTSLNNGDIKTQFISSQKYIEFIKNSPYLDYNMTSFMICTPGVLAKDGINLIVFEKVITTTKKQFEKETISEDFYLLCSNTEDKSAIRDPARKTLFFLKENKNYYPIVQVKKANENTKDIIIDKVFNYEPANKSDKPDKIPIVNHISDFYEKNCYGSFLDDVIHGTNAQTARDTYNILGKLGKDNARFQIVDIRNKCKYLITSPGLIIPVKSSGSVYNLQIIKSPEKYIGQFEQTYKKLSELYEKSSKELNIKPKGVYFDSKKGTKYNIIAIITRDNNNVPVVPELVEKSVLDTMGLAIEDKPLYDKIDKEIAKGKNNFIIDTRIKKVNEQKWEDESYELFRLEFSNFINSPENSEIKKKLESILFSTKITKQEKTQKTILFIYRLIDRELYSTYKNIVLKVDEDFLGESKVPIQENGQMGGRLDRFIHIISKKPNLVNYQVNNDREVCPTHPDKDSCQTNPHCYWAYSGCHLGITNRMVIGFVNRVSEELVAGELKASELLRIGNYFVSDIVDVNRFTEHTGQKIIRSSSNTIGKALNDLFGKDNVPTIGKRRGIKQGDVNYQQMNLDNPLKDMRDIYLQKVIENNLSIFRAYVNGYYWNKYNFYDTPNRNLGYYSPLQTELANYFRSLVIDWIRSDKNKTLVETELALYIDRKKSSKSWINDFIIKLGSDVRTITGCVAELYVLNKIQKIPVLVSDMNNTLLYFIDDGIKYDHENKKDIGKIKTEAIDKIILIRFDYSTQKYMPDNIYVAYRK